MTDRIQCFLLTPAEYAKESLRRYNLAEDNECLPMKYHNAVVDLGIVPFPHSEFDGSSRDDLDPNDPRWPQVCSCGYTFKDDDPRQHNLIRMYQGEGVTLTTLGEAPLGSMWVVDWYEDKWKGPDGLCLIVKTPGGDWIVDGPSKNNDGSMGLPWTRTGRIPNVTATPSIHIPGKYHGWLRNGFLESC